MVKTYPSEIDQYFGKNPSEKSQEEKDSKVDFIKTQLKKMHDTYHPKAIFLTQTSATLYGWTVKEFWKNAWPNEEVPKIFTIDTGPIFYSHVGQKLKGNEEGFSDYVKDLEQTAELIKKVDLGPSWLEDKFVRIISPIYRGEGSLFDRFPSKEDRYRAILNESKNPSYIPYAAGFGVVNLEWEEFKKTKEKVESKLRKSKIQGNVCIVDEGPSIGNSNDRLSTGKTLKIGKRILEEARKEGYMIGKVGDYGLSNTANFEKADGGPWKREGTSYRIVKDPLERKSAQEKIRIYKQFGREIGQELYGEMEKRRRLEEKVNSLVAITGFLGSLIFFHSNVAGNAIADLSTNTTSWISSILFVIGLFAGFFLIKGKNRK